MDISKMKLSTLPLYEEARPLPFCTLYGELHTMEIFDDLLRYRETETLSRVCRTSLVYLIETIEDIGNIFFGYAFPGISDSESLFSYSQSDLPIFRGEFFCISDDIPDCREEELRIYRYHHLLLFDEIETSIFTSE